MGFGSQTYSVDDLIQSPPYIMASLLSDEVYTERDLIIDVVSGANITIDGSLNNTPLISTIDDYYNSAILVNVTRSERYSVNDYDGGLQKLTLASVPAGWSAGDKCYLKNVNVTFDTDSFNVVGDGIIESGTTTSTTTSKLVDTGQNFLSTVKVGMRVKNTTDTTYTYVKAVDSNSTLTLMNDIFVSGEGYQIYGTRYGWLFDRVLTRQEFSQDILNQLCFESYSMLFKNYEDKYKVISLEGGSTLDTLTFPMTDNGNISMFVDFTSLDNIYTDFTLNYNYDYANKIYRESHFVNKDYASDSSLNTYKTNCKSAYEDYKINKREWAYNADWIQDSTTAINFISLMIQLLTAQRMIVTWTGDIKTYFKYEIGDRVLINYSKMIPTGINNSSPFLVMGKNINFKTSQVILTLFEVVGGSSDEARQLITQQGDAITTQDGDIIVW